MSNLNKVQYSGITTVVHPCGVVAVAPTVMLGHKVKRFVAHHEANGDVTRMLVSDIDVITAIAAPWQSSVQTQSVGEPETSENWLTRTARHEVHLVDIEPMDNRRTIEHHLNVHGESVYHNDLNPNSIRELPPKDAVGLTLLKVGDRVTKLISGASDHVYTVIGFSEHSDPSLGEFVHINSSNYWMAYHPKLLIPVPNGNVHVDTQMELTISDEEGQVQAVIDSSNADFCGEREFTRTFKRNTGWMGSWADCPPPESRPCDLTVVMHQYAVECATTEGDPWVYFKSSIPPSLIGIEATEGERSIWAGRLLAEAAKAYWLDRCNGCEDTVHDHHLGLDFGSDQFYVYHKSSLRPVTTRAEPVIYGSAKPKTVIQYETTLNDYR